jgi:flagellar hook-basal body complex protein FliE
MSTPISANGMPNLERAAPLERLAPLPRGDATAGGQAASNGVDFSKVMSNALTEAGQAERSADQSAKQFAAGDPNVGIHEVMISAEKAQVMLRYTVTLKNRLLEAYKELMNTPV